MTDFEYYAPKTLEEALDLYQQFGEGARLYAGGTELVNQMRAGIVKPRQLIDLKHIPGLDTIHLTPTGLKLGALTKIHDIEFSELIQQAFPAISHAAGSLGSVQVRNKATIGGNICRCSPSADNIPPLMALDASLKIVEKGCEKTVPIADFLLGPGKTILKPGQIMTEIFVPNLPHYSGCTYLKLSPRKQMDLAVVGVALMLTTDKTMTKCLSIRIAMGAVGPVPMRAPKTEAILMGNQITTDLLEQAAQMASTECKPMNDVRATEWYRRKMVAVLVKRAFTASLKSITAAGDGGQNAKNN
jgi:carbon-monoxide dehydrogenase medium subunit